MPAPHRIKRLHDPRRARSPNPHPSACCPNPAKVAQSVEHTTENRGVGSSILPPNDARSVVRNPPMPGHQPIDRLTDPRSAPSPVTSSVVTESPDASTPSHPAASRPTPHPEPPNHNPPACCPDRAWVAQSVEHTTENRGVGSSILPLRTTHKASFGIPQCQHPTRPLASTIPPTHSPPPNASSRPSPNHNPRACRPNRPR